MKILVLGNPNSKWTKDLIEKVFLTLGLDVSVILNGKSPYEDFYRQNKVTIKHGEEAGALIKRIPLVRVLDSLYRTVRSNEWDEYDYIINMFVNPKDLILSRILSRNKKTKVITYFCGSDLLRRSDSRIRTYYRIARPSEVFVGSRTLYNSYTSRFPELPEPTVVRFGMGVLDDISDTDNFGMPLSDDRKKTFCIGYNGGRAQQHIKVIQAISGLDEEYRRRINLVIPMTYEFDQSYENEVIKELEKTGISYKILTEFMNSKQMAEMWSQIGFFINAQTTDSLSASVLESLYAGCTLINGKWLRYPEYEEFGIKFYEFNDFSDLLPLIESIVKGEKKTIMQEDSKLIYNQFSWEKARSFWKDFLF